MGLRPAKCYSNKGLRHDRAYTRIAVRKPRRNYIGTSPGLKTRQFNMGNPNRKYTHIANLRVEETMQVRDNAIEATRIAVNRYLVNKLGKDMFFMRIRVYPHQILRENKQAQGAHADRIQKGMSHPFGKPIGRAVRAKAGQIILSVLVEESQIKVAKKALERAKAKFPCKVSVDISTDIKSLGSLPSKRRLAAKEAKSDKADADAKAKEDAKEETKAEGGKKAEGKDKEEGKGAEAKGEKKEGAKGENAKESGGKEEKK